MKSKVLYVLLLLISVLVAATVGFFVGSRFTTHRFAHTFQDLAFDNNSVNLMQQVKLLELLKKQENRKTQELLEKIMDVNLAGLSIYGNTPPAERSKAIIDAIRQVKDYRKRYPGHQVSPAFSESVQRALDLAE
jgi:hypothetical protein